MFKLKIIIILLFSLFFMRVAVADEFESTGTLSVDSFSWYLGPNGIVIDSASASFKPPKYLCTITAIKCGLALGLRVRQGLGSTETSFIPVSSGSYETFTLDTAVSVINSLSGKTISGTSHLNAPDLTIEACLWVYKTSSGATQYTKIFAGVCGNGYIPPVPVPTSCDLIMDNSVMDFGDISAAAFYAAGAGGKPAGVEMQQRTLNVSCTSPLSSLAYLRMTTGTASGNMLVSSNKDVGFLLSAGSANDPSVNPLTPNSTASSYPLTLDSTGKASVTIKAIPVSVTGKKPAAGSFTSNALLNISWN